MCKSDQNIGQQISKDCLKAKKQIFDTWLSARYTIYTETINSGSVVESTGATLRHPLSGNIVLVTWYRCAFEAFQQ